MTRFLPIIIIVSLLGVFLLVFFVVFTYQFTRARKRRKTLETMPDLDKPTRQLIVRSGKVIPASEALDTISTRGMRSSLGKSVHSLKSKYAQDAGLQSPRFTKSFDRRRSSGLRDLEAQREGSESWEANVRALNRLEERLRKPQSHFITQSDEAERRASASSQKIAASLKKAYKGTPAIETEKVDIPPTPGSKPAEIRTIVRKKKSSVNPEIIAHSDTNGTRIEPMRFSKELRKPKSDLPRSSRSSTFDAVGFALSTNSVQLPPPMFTLDRRSSRSRSKRRRNLGRTSFLSMSTSPTSSTSSWLVPTTSKVPPSSRAESQDSQRRPQSAVGDSESTPKPRMGMHRTQPLSIDTGVPQMRETSYTDSAAVSAITARSIRRDSMMSSNSIATFASSDISSTWTFGNALPVAIVPGVMPRAKAPSPSSRRPKSKYGRYPKPKEEKELPVLPKSPLSGFT